MQVLTDPELGAEEDDEDGGDPGEAGQEDDQQQQRAVCRGQNNNSMSFTSARTKLAMHADNRLLFDDTLHLHVRMCYKSQVL